MRTFLALDLDEDIVDRLSAMQQRLDDGESHIAWVGRQNLHLTLVFLGDVPDDLLPQVCDIAAAAAGQYQPFGFEIKGITCTPPHGQPRMFWANTIDPAGRLHELQEDLAEGLHGLGLRQEERSFKAHITLARIKQARNPGRLRQAARALAGEEFGIQHVEQVVVYSSQLTPKGSIYTPIARAVLGR